MSVSSNHEAVPEVNYPTVQDKIKKSLNWRVVLSSYLGSVAEWFDFFLYSIAAASVFNVIFFPHFSRGAGTLLALATLAIGYLVRPIGGVIYGHFGDRLGRKKMLVSSICLMGIATIAVGLMPTYAQIGMAAPITLLLLRIIQGFAAAGEWGGALLMTLEHSSPNRRGVSSSVIGMGQCTGLLLATLIFALISKLPAASFLAWGWRVPFIGAVLLVVLGLWLRLGVEESPVFLEDVARRSALVRTPFMEVMRSGRVQVLQCFLMVLGPFSISALISPFCIAYAIQSGFPRSVALQGASVAALCQVIGMLCGGWASDKVGRRPILMLGAVMMAVGIYAMFYLASSGTPSLLYLGFAVAGLCHGTMFGPLGAFISELFKTNTRFTGASLGYQLGGAFGGGMAPVIGTSLVMIAGGYPHTELLICFSTFVCLVSFAVAICSRETYRDYLTNDAARTAA